MARANRFDGQLRWLHNVRLYPTCAQRSLLLTMLRLTRELYNALLEQRREYWRRDVTGSPTNIARLPNCEPTTPRSRQYTATAWTPCCTGSTWPSRRSFAA